MSARLLFRAAKMPKMHVRKKAKPVKMAIQAAAKMSSFPETPDMG